ncbi:MAG: HU family DNA-binding protein [Phycisphaeraceae bacterium]|nr:HU family DNA-binding protein [Phycisphaeraceae bacterium]MCB9848729.1 HU family DNA-binding protein [Phycisphaeraceae bacterium]
MATRKTTRKTTRKSTARKATRKSATRSTPRKKATRRTTTRKKTAAARPSLKMTQTSKPRTKAEIYRLISEATELTRQQVASVFECMGEIIEKDLKKGGPGAVNMAGLMKVTVQRKPAVPKRKGINPFTGEEQWFKAKPARNVVKIRPLKSLKDRV